MKALYRYLSWGLAVLVAVQAGLIALAMFGLFSWVFGAGGTLDAATVAGGGLPFAEAVGFMIHGELGTLYFPLLALVLVIVSLLTRAEGATRWALLVFLLTGVQIALGMFGHDSAALGGLHGANAMLLFGAALIGPLAVGRRARRIPVAEKSVPEQANVVTVG